eukprot:GHVU01035125.1.p2 GENE.GHVU01035125.1~~GHVU01035125.1.p2  ORF type:complete len:117 (+),score=18.61 GHVU01035125.1:214-564(+)
MWQQQAHHPEGLVGLNQCGAHLYVDESPTLNTLRRSRSHSVATNSGVSAMQLPPAAIDGLEKAPPARNACHYNNPQPQPGGGGGMVGGGQERRQRVGKLREGRGRWVAIIIQEVEL